MIEITRRRIRIDGRPEHRHGRRGALLPRRPRGVGRSGSTCSSRPAATRVASYIPWLFHELPDGTIDVTGETRPERDVGAFIDLAADRACASSPGPGRSSWPS